MYGAPAGGGRTGVTARTRFIVVNKGGIMWGIAGGGGGGSDLG